MNLSFRLRFWTFLGLPAVLNLALFGFPERARSQTVPRSLAWQPTLQLTDVPPPSGDAFYRVSDAKLVGDTAILVANAGTDRLFLLKMDGTLVREFGRGGRGPGEFEVLSRISVQGDTVSVFDQGLVRVSRWLLDGTLVLSQPLTPITRRSVGVHGFFDDGSLLAYIPPRSPLDREGTHQLAATLIRIALPDSTVHDLGETPWGARFVTTGRNGPVATSAAYPAPLRPRGDVTASGSRYWYSNALDGTIVSAIPGEEAKEVTLPVDRVAVSQRDRNAYRDDWIGSVRESSKPRLRRVIEKMTFPEYLPTIVDLIPAEKGTVWAGAFGRSGDAVRRWWHVAEDGQVLDEVLLPAQFSMMDASEEYLLGITIDEFGIETVVALPYRRPAR